MKGPRVDWDGVGTFAAAAGPFPGLIRAGLVFDLRPHLGAETTIRCLLEDWDASFRRLEELATRLDADAAHAPLADVRPLPPVLPTGEVFQAAANYHEHVLSLLAGAARRGDDSDGLNSARARDAATAALEERIRSGDPFVFLGSAHAMVGAKDDVVIPSDCSQADWEIELAAVIGRRARRVPRERALDFVAGYTICNDITSRDALNRSDAGGLGIDWLAAKSAPTFLPTGPVLVPAALVPDPMNLRLRLSVNGSLMQDDRTADMLFDIAALIEYVSSIAELRPGDFVLTGSPKGNGASYGVFLKPGDLIEASIEGLGSQTNVCVAEGRNPSATALPAGARVTKGAHR